MVAKTENFVHLPIREIEESLRLTVAVPLETLGPQNGISKAT